MLMRSIFILGLPVVVFLGGGAIMSHLSGRDRVIERLRQLPDAADRRPLNSRLHYDAAAVQRHWGALDPSTLAAEQRSLELDLIFPLLYGAALASSLLLAWAALGRPFNPAWVIAPVAITILSDWTENLVLLSQSRLFALIPSTPPDSSWIAVATTATTLKLAFFTTSYLGIVCLFALMFLRRAR
jgi:hypothetical protein